MHPLPEDKVTLQVIHVDDNIFDLERMQGHLESLEQPCHFKVEILSSAEELEQRLSEKNHADIVILDVLLESETLSSSSEAGIGLISKVRQVWPGTAIIMCSNLADAGVIRLSLERGADDFLCKRADREEMGFRVFQAYQFGRLKRGFLPMSQATKMIKSQNPIVGNTMEGIAHRMARLVNSAVTAVHVRGESGTGKEVIADLIMAQLPPKVPFVRVNCAAIAPSLLESELFGHVKGAFTGAALERKGWFESASGGWIFLDEVATLTLAAQAALLRVLENQEIVRVGESHTRKINVKVISATNVSLEKLVREGSFRKDLWQRLCETEILLTPLRERSEEIEIFVHHFCRVMPGGPFVITPPALQLLKELPWSEGNIRELRNCLRAMTEFHINRMLTPLSIPKSVLERRVAKDQTITEEISTASHKSDTLSERVQNTDSTEAQLKKPPLLSIPLKGVTLEDIEDQVLSHWLRMRLEHKLSLRTVAKELSVARNTLVSHIDRCHKKDLLTVNEYERLKGKEHN